MQEADLRPGDIVGAHQAGVQGEPSATGNEVILTAPGRSLVTQVKFMTAACMQTAESSQIYQITAHHEFYATTSARFCGTAVVCTGSEGCHAILTGSFGRSACTEPGGIISGRSSSDTALSRPCRRQLAQHFSTTIIQPGMPTRTTPLDLSNTNSKRPVNTISAALRISHSSLQQALQGLPPAYLWYPG